MPTAATPQPRAIFRAPQSNPGATSAMERAFRSAERIAPTDATVLISGEPGSGKEVLARFIHQQSGRGGAFIPVNCSVVPEAMLEGELFGYSKDAFPGAVQARRGRMAGAEGGTLFLDEVGDLPLSLQVKLLRVLEERSYTPMGSEETRAADFRLIAASNRDLRPDVEAGRFRRDLYYRLFVCPLQIPSLRERAEEIPGLYDHFWRARGESRPVEPQVYAALQRYAWPGNVRELENIVERVALGTDGPVIRAADVMMLAGPVERARVERQVAPSALEGELTALLDSHGIPAQLMGLLTWFENVVIDRALESSGGNKKAAADLMGMQRTTLVEKLRRRHKVESRAALCGTVSPLAASGTDGAALGRAG